MHPGNWHQSMWSRVSPATGAMTFCAWKLLLSNVLHQTVCVWPPGSRVQKQTGLCRLGLSGVNVGAAEAMECMVPAAVH